MGGGSLLDAGEPCRCVLRAAEKAVDRQAVVRIALHQPTDVNEDRPYLQCGAPFVSVVSLHLAIPSLVSSSPHKPVLDLIERPTARPPLKECRVNGPARANVEQGVQAEIERARVTAPTLLQSIAAAVSDATQAVLASFFGKVHQGSTSSHQTKP
ncbi:MAG: hypothetical protein ACJ8DK_19000 [Microvirga sp.]